MTKKFSYNQALDEIQQIVEKIETEELDIDELSSNVKKVTSLIKLCKQKLLETEKEINQMMSEVDS